MKLLILYCIASVANTCVYSQQISVSFKNTPFREVISHIEKETHYTFVYTSRQIQKIPNSNISKDSISIDELLNVLLPKNSIGYVVDGNHIILVTNTERKRSIQGRVITNSGVPVAGATVYLQKENSSTTTNEDGSFELFPISSETALLVTGAEIIPLEVTTGPTDFLEIKVKQQIRELDETIILGYGSTTRRFSTGNAVKVNLAEINKLPRNDLLQFLKGKVPGMLITSSGSAPGASSLMQIRGQHSINPNPLLNYVIPPVDQPLIILNGIPFSPQNNNINQLASVSSPGSLDIYQNPYGGISPFTLIDPSDIESIEVLKDAVATSLYGSRSANGVLLITTRQPTSEKLSIETIISSGVTMRTAASEMLSTAQYRELRKTAFSNDSIQPSLIERSLYYAPDLLLFDSSRDVNWARYFYHATATLWNGHLRLSGSIGRIFFTSSISLRNEEHLLKGNFFSKQLTSNQQLRYTSLNKRLSSSFSAYYSNGKNLSVAAPALLRVISLPPNYPELHDSDGRLSWMYNGLPIADNPAAYLLQTYTINMAAIHVASKTEYLLAHGLTTSLRAGYSGTTTRESSIMPPASLSQQQHRNVRAIYGTGKFITTILEPQIEYKWSSNKFSLLIMSGATLQHHSVFLESKRGSGYAENIMTLTLANAARSDQRQIHDRNIYQSLLTRVSLKFLDKYMLDLTGRREHSSHFSDNSKKGLFSSVGVGWIFSEEPALKKHNRFLSYGKLRVSYGTTGNDNIGYTHFRDSWSRIPTYTGNQAVTNSLNGIPFGWSVTQKAEAALELFLLNDRLSLTVSSYFHRTDRQLISQLLPGQNALSRYILNFPAIVHNRGFEFTATYRSAERNKLKHSAQLNITSHRNYLSSFEGIETSLYGRRYWEGFPLETKQPLRFDGVDPKTGIYLFHEDRSHYVSTAPKLYGGLTQTIGIGRWKAEWQFDFRFQTGINHLRTTYSFPPGSNINQPAETAGYWRTEGDITLIQKPTTSTSSAAMLASFLIPRSDAIFSNASFLCLRNLSISRTMNTSRLLHSAYTIQLYIQLQNIFTVTRFPLADPETQSFYSYPRAATFTAGIILKK
jgi:TonB-linked SusC/RagA family outer membrane protein